MARSYDDAADGARDEGVIDPVDVDRQQIRDKLERFLQREDPNSSGARKLVDETADRVMDQEVGSRTTGGVAGKRENLSTWTDRWGNVMSYNRNTGNYHRLADADDI